MSEIGNHSISSGRSILTSVFDPRPPNGNPNPRRWAASRQQHHQTYEDARQEKNIQGMTEAEAETREYIEEEKEEKFGKSSNIEVPGVVTERELKPHKKRQTQLLKSTQLKINEVRALMQRRKDDPELDSIFKEYEQSVSLQIPKTKEIKMNEIKAKEIKAKELKDEKELIDYEDEKDHKEKDMIHRKKRIETFINLANAKDNPKSKPAQTELSRIHRREQIHMGEEDTRVSLVGTDENYYMREVLDKELRSLTGTYASNCKKYKKEFYGDDEKKKLQREYETKRNIIKNKLKQYNLRFY